MTEHMVEVEREPALASSDALTPTASATKTDTSRAPASAEQPVRMRRRPDPRKPAVSPVSRCRVALRDRPPADLGWVFRNRGRDGPPPGGWIVDHLTWQTIFLVNPFLAQRRPSGSTGVSQVLRNGGQRNIDYQLVNIGDN